MTAKLREKKLLVVDDEPDIGVFVRDVAEDAGFNVSVVSSFSEFRQAYTPDAFTGIILDLQMPDKDGLEYLRLLCDTGCGAGIVVMSGYDARVLGTASRFGKEQGLHMLGVLQKPLQITDMLDVFERIDHEAKVVTLDDIEAGLANREFIFEFQPKIHLTDDVSGDDPPLSLSLGPGRLALHSFEALVRWRHPTYGMLAPDRFVPLAEANDVIHRFSHYVVDAALRQASLWQESGFPAAVAINLPANLVTDPSLPDLLAARTEQAGIPYDRIVLEVTETAAMENAAQAMGVLGRLRLKGFRLSMDDFGTGYSSLVQLHRMPFNELKIDKSVILELGINRDAEAIVRSIIDLGHNLGMEVCAEGVETAEVLAILKDFGCDIAQGFYLSRPMSPDDAAACAGLVTIDADKQITALDRSNVAKVRP